MATSRQRSLHIRPTRALLVAAGLAVLLAWGLVAAGVPSMLADLVTPVTDPRSPTEVVNAAIDLAAQGRFSEAERLFCAEALPDVRGDFAWQTGLTAWNDPAVPRMPAPGAEPLYVAEVEATESASVAPFTLSVGDRAIRITGVVRRRAPRDPQFAFEGWGNNVNAVYGLRRVGGAWRICESISGWASARPDAFS